MTSRAAAYGRSPHYWVVLSHRVQEHQFPAPAANQCRMSLIGRSRTVGRDNGIDDEEEEVMVVAAAAVAVA